MDHRLPDDLVRYIYRPVRQPHLLDHRLHWCDELTEIKLLTGRLLHRVTDPEAEPCLYLRESIPLWESRVTDVFVAAGYRLTDEDRRRARVFSLYRAGGCG